MSPAATTALRTLFAIAVSLAGGFLGHLSGLPAGWLMGGAIAVSIASIAGLPLAFPDRLRDFTFLLVGMSMGTTVARDSLALIMQWPVTMAALVIELVLILVATGYMLQKLFKLDRGTAYMSSFPGHLSLVMGIAAAGVGDPRQIVVIQSLRVMLLTICVPIGALFLPVGDFIGGPVADMPIPILLLLAAACLVGGVVFERLRIPAAFSLGAMAVATVAKLSGLIDGSLPEPLVIISFVLIGALIGSRFSGISREELLKATIGGIIATIMTVTIVTAISLIAARFVDMPFAQIWLGLAPGALEGMGALGVALGFDTAFIAAHHVTRLLLLSFAIPLVAVIVAPKKNRTIAAPSSGPDHAS